MTADDDLQDWDEGDPTWEQHAKDAVVQAWENAYFDEVRGVIEIPDRDEPRRSVSCDNIEDLQIALSEIYTNEWYGYVPFDSGEAVFEDDADGFVGDFLTDHKDAEEFFESLRVEEAEEDLYQSDETVERAAMAINTAGCACLAWAHEPGHYDDCPYCRGVCLALARAALTAATGDQE